MKRLSLFMLLLAVLSFLGGIGCGGVTTAPSQSKPVTPVKPKDNDPAPILPPSLPIPDPKLMEFRTRMQAFIDESTSLTRVMIDSADPPLCEKKLEMAKDLFSRIPDPPQKYEDAYTNAKIALANLALNNISLSYAAQFRRLGDKAKADDVVKACQADAKETKAMLLKIEERLK